MKRADEIEILRLMLNGMWPRDANKDAVDRLVAQQAGSTT